MFNFHDFSPPGSVTEREKESVELNCSPSCRGGPDFLCVDLEKASFGAFKDCNSTRDSVDSLYTTLFVL